MAEIIDFKPPVKKIDFDGPCPFLTCLESGSHSHPICPKCGAVKHGNANCDECRSHWKHAD
jgi:hypothetical protein